MQGIILKSNDVIIRNTRSGWLTASVVTDAPPELIHAAHHAPLAFEEFRKFVACSPDFLPGDELVCAGGKIIRYNCPNRRMYNIIKFFFAGCQIKVYVASPRSINNAFAIRNLEIQLRQAMDAFVAMLAVQREISKLSSIQS